MLAATGVTMTNLLNLQHNVGLHDDDDVDNEEDEQSAEIEYK